MYKSALVMNVEIFGWTVPVLLHVLMNINLRHERSSDWSTCSRIIDPSALKNDILSLKISSLAGLETC